MPEQPAPVSVPRQAPCRAPTSRRRLWAALQDAKTKVSYCNCREIYLIRTAYGLRLRSVGMIVLRAVVVGETEEDRGRSRQREQCWRAW